jgi:hypothetical protein
MLSDAHLGREAAAGVSLVEAPPARVFTDLSPKSFAFRSLHKLLRESVISIEMARL